MKWSADYVKALPDSAFAYVASDGSRYLPYKNADGRVSLPQVRDALKDLGSVDVMNAADRENAKDKLQGSLKASDADDDVMSFVSPIQASDGDSELPQRMMLLRAGTFNTSKYGEVPLSATDLSQMADNFKAGLGMAGDGSTGIPVDYAHQSHLNAAAWIKDVAAEKGGEELWATSIEWSKSGRDAILGKEYKCLSSDFYPAAFGEWVDAESGVRAKNVIVGAALTNRPMFTGNQPVVTASETSEEGHRQITKYVIASEKEQSMNIDEVRVKAADDLSGAEQRFLQANAEKLSTEEKAKFEIVEPVKADDSKETKIEASSVKGDEGVVKIEASEVKGMQDQIAALQASEQNRIKASVAAEVDKHIARGAIKADRKDSYVARLSASSETDRSELLADLEALASNPLLAKEQGSGDADESSTTGAREKIMAMASEVVKKSEGKTDIKAAVAAVKAENPELAAAAASERVAVVAGASEAEFKAAGVNRG